MTAFKAGPFKAALIQTNVSNEMAENVAFVRAQAAIARREPSSPPARLR